jgi:hypothetical protein
MKTAAIASLVVSSGIGICFLSPARSEAGCSAPPSGLVAWWRAEGNANDIIGSNDGMLFNGTTFNSGVVGQAFGFDGTGAHIRVSDSPSLRFTNAFAVEGWVYPTDVSNQRDIITKWDVVGGIDQRAFVAGILPGGAFELTLAPFGTSGSMIVVASTNHLAPNQWTYVAATYDGSSVKVYVNGVLDTQVAYNLGIFPSTDAIGIGAAVGGAGPGGNGGAWAGRIDEISLYNRALSDTEVHDIFAASGAGKCSPVDLPTIVSQPTNTTVTVGTDGIFRVSATGTTPLFYQWRRQGTNLPSATADTLTLHNVQLTDAGTYAVTISNRAGIVSSSNAVLTVNSGIPCFGPPPDIASWWAGEANANDAIGVNNGTLMNGAGFASGIVGQAFSFDGVNDHVRIPDHPSLHFSNGLTIECWLFPTDVSAYHEVVSKWDMVGAVNQMSYTSGIQPDGTFGFTLSPSGSAASMILVKSTNAVPVNQWTHVAGTYDGSSVRVYINGVMQNQASYNLGIFPGTNALGIGAAIGGGAPGDAISLFKGKIDEISLYSRALSASEIQSIVAAGSSGKCKIPVPPTIASQPASRTVIVGSSATFAVGASGTGPLSYQWAREGVPLAGATDSSLTLSNIQLANAGRYAVVVTNAQGSVTSSNAVLTVNLPPPLVRVGSTNSASGATVTIPITITANGNENAVGFSLSFPPSLLSFVSADSGAATASAAFLVNANDLSSGRVGIAMALPSGETLALGTQEIALVTFTTAVVTNSPTANVGIGDVPIGRQVADTNGQAISATYASGSITIAPAEFEADVFPRAGGDRDVTLSDWVLIGRYVARLDSPTNGNEFQRADCAPRSTRGNGNLTVADWVQAGRYAARLDPLTLLGGPSAPGPVPPPPSFHPNDLGQRDVKVTDNQLLPGQSVTVSILLNSQGDENALGFTLGFDPNALSIVSATLGSNANGSTLNVNTNQATAGAVGLALAKSFGSSFTSGTDEVIKVTFRSSSTAAGSYALTLNDQVVPREISDANASALTSTYTAGSITVNPPPALNIGLSGQNIALSWPATAGDYTLQQNTDLTNPAGWTPVSPTLSTNANQISTVVPASGDAMFYRLSHP